MASVLKKLQAFVPTMDDTVGNLGAQAAVAAMPPIAPARAPAPEATSPQAMADAEDSEPQQSDAMVERAMAAKVKAKGTKGERKKPYDALSEIPRTSFGAMDGRAIRRTGRTMQISLKVKPELYEAMKVVSYEQAIGLGAMMEEMWDAYLQQRRAKRGP